MIHFVGAGCGAPDLITVRGMHLLEKADVIIYAGSLVNPELLKNCQKDCQIYNSAKMTLEEVMEVMISGEKQEKKVVRLHTGDPCLYGAIKEQMDLLEKENISYKVCPGVSSFCGAASALNAEYTLPGISQLSLLWSAFSVRRGLASSYSVFNVRMELRIAITDTPTSANTASHMLAMPRAPRMSTSALTARAKTMFW